MQGTTGQRVAVGCSKMWSQVLASYNKFKQDLAGGADVANLQQQLLALKVRGHVAVTFFSPIFFTLRRSCPWRSMVFCRRVMTRAEPLLEACWNKVLFLP